MAGLFDIRPMQKNLRMPRLLPGASQDIINSNVQMLKEQGYSHPRAVRTALAHMTKMGGAVKMKPRMPKMTNIGV